MPGPSTFQAPRVARLNNKVYWAIGGVALLVGIAWISATTAQQPAAPVAVQRVYAVRKTSPWVLPAEKPIAPVQSPTPIAAAKEQILAPAPILKPAPAVKMKQPKPQPKEKKERKGLVLVEGPKEEQGEEKNPFVLDSKVWPLPSPYTVLSGNVVPCSLVTGINAELPGTIKCQTTENVYDSVTQSHLLIPQGSAVLGAYDHQLVENQERVLIVWNRIIFPNGNSMSLGEMSGVDVEGYSGFTDIVNNHFLAVFSKALLLSMISTAANLGQNGTSGRSYNDSYNAPGQIASAELGQQMGRTSSEVVRRGLNRPPTIEIRPGYLAQILVKKDIIFDKPYNQ